MALTWMTMAVSAEALREAALLMVVGMGVVFLALILIMLMLVAMQQLSSEGAKAPVPTPPRVESAATAVPGTNPGAGAESSGIAPEIVAVISAVVVAIAGSRARIHSIRLVRPAGQSPWAEQGRSRHHQSHRIRRGKP